MPFIESVTEFHERHGGDEHSIFVKNWWIYEDGAVMENPTQGYGARKEPPDDPREFAENRLFYWEHRLQEAVENFDAYRDEVAREAEATVRIASGDTATGTCIHAGNPKHQSLGGSS